MDHSFDVEVAKERGIDQALILRHLQFWIIKNRADGRNFRDGHFWTFTSVRALTKIFPYWTEDQIGYAVGRLVMDGILIKGNFNRTAFDRTIWYAFQEEEKWLPKEETRDAETGKPIPEKSQIDSGKVPNRFRKSTEPIPYNPTDESKDKTKQSENGFSEKIDKIILHLNERTKQNYRIGAQANRRIIKARLEEGATVNECLEVIDKMADEWMGTKSEIYLRPETLFGATKFQGYTNRKRRNVKDPWAEEKHAEAPDRTTAG